RQNPHASPPRNVKARGAFAPARPLPSQERGRLMSVELTTREDCAVLTLNRPEALNALSVAILGQIGEAFDAVAKSKARALIITGGGNKAFWACADNKELLHPPMRHC